MKMNNFSRLVLGCLLALAGNAAVAQNVCGHITCDGSGVANVPVSDGYVVVYTDASGYYSFTSEKKNGYVFYSLPSGYEPTTANTFNPQFWAALTAGTSTLETHDFTLKKVDNDKYTMIFAADSHLAKRNSDRSMYSSGYIATMKREKTAADYRGDKIYSTILGDLAWDRYWYENSYDLSNFMADQISYGYPFIMFPVMGNHDNDAGVYASDSTDFVASKPWRKIVCPNYYSYNLGKVHFVVLDDIYYVNSGTGSGTGVVGSRNYKSRIEDYEIEWLKKDLATVDKNTPVIVCLHIPTYRLNSFTPYASLDNTSAMSECLKDFKTVHIMSGHTHFNYHAHPSTYPNIMEHNIASICATWWWTGHLNSNNIVYQVCQDGSPAGYSYWTIDGDSLRWEWKSIAGKTTSQMRIYDMNTVKTFFTTNTYAKSAITKYSSYLTNYSSYADNAILTDVYAWDNDWKLTVTEGVDHELACYRVTERDPYHELAYPVSRFSSGSTSLTTDFITTVNAHMFRSYATTDYLPITVKAVDSFGGVHYKTIQRPLAFSMAMINNEVDYDLGDINCDGNVDVTDVSVLMEKVLGNEPSKFEPITADMNGDGNYDVSDLTLLVGKILNAN